MNLSPMKYQNAFDQLSLPVRSIILSTILGIIFLAWHYVFWKNTSAALTTTSEKIRTLNQSITIMKKQIATMENEFKNKQKTDDKLQNPSGTTLSILPPAQTKEVLHSLLTASNNLVLLQLNNIPPKEIILPQSATRIFEHGLVIKFSGNYFATMDYLKSIENLKWKIFWDKLEYKVTEYPLAEITLSIHTISNNEDWISV